MSSTSCAIILLFISLFAFPVLSTSSDYAEYNATWINQLLNTLEKYPPPPAPAYFSSDYKPNDDDEYVVLFRHEPHPNVTHLIQRYRHANVVDLCHSKSRTYAWVGCFSPQVRAVLQENNQVHAVEPNRWVYASDIGHGPIALMPQANQVRALDLGGAIVDVVTKYNPPSWGLNRIDKRKLTEMPNEFQYPSQAGYNVSVYILDTGLDSDHEELIGRTIRGPNFSLPGTAVGIPMHMEFDESSDDDNGHGTFIAGIIGSKTYGVANNVTIVSVKVLDAHKRTRVSNVIQAIQWVMGQHQAIPGQKAIVNMSFDADKSDAMNQVILNCANAGLLIVAAAGNGDANLNPIDACTRSPASVRHPNVLTIGATDKKDALASFSNRGPCVDMQAPGVDVVSMLPESNAPAVDRGTSFSVPHVVGVAALIWSSVGSSWINDWNATQVRETLMKTATVGALHGTGQSTANVLLYSGATVGKGYDTESVSAGSRLESTWLVDVVRLSLPILLLLFTYY